METKVGSAFRAMVTGREGEAVDDAEGGRFGVDVEGSNWDRPVLVLEVGFDGPAGAEIEVNTKAGRVDGTVGADIEDTVIGESAVEVADAAATDEEVHVGVEAAKPALDFGAEEKVHLAVDVAPVQRVGSTKLKGGPDVGNRQEGEVRARSDAAVFSAEKVGIGAGGTSEGRELKLLGGGGNGLGARVLRKSCQDCQEGQFRKEFRLLHSGVQPHFTRVRE